MNRESLRHLLLQSSRQWNRGTPENTRVPQKSLDRHLLDLAEAAVLPRRRPGRHRGLHARITCFPCPSQA